MPTELRRGTRLTLIARIALTGVVGTLSVTALSVTAELASSSQRTAARDMAQISTGMSRQWNADMLHDGLRADVLASLYAGTDTSRQEAFETSAVHEHTQKMLEHYDVAASLAPANLKTEYQQVRPRIVARGEEGHGHGR
jgi:methyl-accepting chemotaxis protein